jgi:amidohydrolase
VRPSEDSILILLTYSDRLDQQIFSNPETAFQEVTAHDALVAALQVEGIRVTPHAYNIQTAFEAEYGSGGRVLAYNAEYDALPDIGHACGHNLIATTSLGAFLAVVDALKESGKPGRVRLLGTPAEEAIGGKIQLIEAGAYKDVDACLMMHPTSQSVYPEDVLGDAFDKTLAISGFKVTYRGKPSHAALAPWNGVNALDAAVLGYSSVAVLRQQVKPDERIHGIIVEGGVAANIIPDKAVLEFGVRGPTLAGVHILQERVLNCFKGAADATGCEIEIEMLGEYADLRANIPICRAFQDAMIGLGHKMQCNVDRETTPASTDQGNVSYECPSWHGIFGIPSEEGAFPHTKGFAKGAGSAASFDRALLSCEGMAVAGYRFLTDDDLADQVKTHFLNQKLLD